MLSIDNFLGFDGSRAGLTYLNHFLIFSPSKPIPSSPFSSFPFPSLKTPKFHSPPPLLYYNKDVKRRQPITSTQILAQRILLPLNVVHLQTIPIILTAGLLFTHQGHQRTDDTQDLRQELTKKDIYTKEGRSVYHQWTVSAIWLEVL